MKLTLVSLMCRRYVMQVFIQLRTDDKGKVFISRKKVDELFFENYGFAPNAGETIGITPKSVGFSK